VGDVRRYLREFLSDARVLDVPAVVRWLLVNLWIAPLRARSSARLYAAVWGEAGSPLLVHSLALRAALERELGAEFRVMVGMRYGEPSIGDALGELGAAGVSRVIALPLYPQYASSSTGSALEALFAAAGHCWNAPALDVLPEFFAAPGFVAALAAAAQPVLEGARPDHLLMSYHGLPERQIRKSAPDSPVCLREASCCDALRADNARCYRAQCFATSRALARALGLADGAWSIAFQSRLGRTPWIRPFTDEALPQLAARGVTRLAVTCPSFAADCLETVEEIGVRARAQWRACGGETLELIPCPNAHPVWVRALAGLVRARVECAAEPR
jgi:ferrochelatase